MFTKMLCIVLITIMIVQASLVVPEERAERSASPQDFNQKDVLKDFLGGLFKNLFQPASNANNSASGDNNAANVDASGGNNTVNNGTNNNGTPDVGKMALDTVLGFGKLAGNAFKLFGG